MSSNEIEKEGPTTSHYTRESPIDEKLCMKHEGTAHEAAERGHVATDR